MITYIGSVHGKGIHRITKLHTTPAECVSELLKMATATNESTGDDYRPEDNISRQLLECGSYIDLSFSYVIEEIQPPQNDNQEIKSAKKIRKLEYHPW